LRARAKNCKKTLDKREEVLCTRGQAMLSRVKEQKGLCQLLPCLKGSANGWKRKLTLKLKLLESLIRQQFLRVYNPSLHLSLYMVLQLLLLLANDSVPPSQTMEIDASKLAGTISVRNPFNSAHTTVTAAHVSVGHCEKAQKQALQ
jgi:hypothetical protein